MNIFSEDSEIKSGCVLKIGEVTSLDPSGCKVRVTFDDEDSVTSDWLPVLQPNTLDNHDYRMPDIGEDVLCLFTGESAETGFVIGSFYAGEIQPPTSSGDIRMVQFKDGSVIQYDRGGHKLKVVISGTKIEADQQNINVTAPQKIKNSGGRQVDIEGGSMVNIATPVLNLTVGGTKMTLNGSSATLESQNLTLKGSLTVTGNMNVQGNISGTGSMSVSGVVSGSNI